MTRNEIINKVRKFDGVAVLNGDPFAIEDAQDYVISKLENCGEISYYEPDSTDEYEWETMILQLGLTGANVSRIYETNDFGTVDMLFVIGSDYKF